MQTHRYPLSPDPIFSTLQGEGHLRGFRMTFVRLAGCSVGCAQCDTNYKVDSHATVKDIIDRVVSVRPNGDRDNWVWITGGEPTDHDLRPLLKHLRLAGCSVAVLTSGVRRLIEPVAWLSVSPHSCDPTKFVQRYGQEIKIVDGLNGLNLDEWISTFPDDTNDFMYRYVQPLWVGTPEAGREDPASLARCLEFLKWHPRWALSRQDHKAWGLA